MILAQIRHFDLCCLVMGKQKISITHAQKKIRFESLSISNSFSSFLWLHDFSLWLWFISTGAGEVRRGEGHGEPHQRLRVPGVLGQDQGRSAGGVRDGHQGGAAGQEARQEGRLHCAIERQGTQGWVGRGGGRPGQVTPPLCVLWGTKLGTIDWGIIGRS